jgi:AAA domain
MALKIVKASEPMQVDNIVLTCYSQPGLGKTSLAFTAAKPLLLDFDKGSYRASNRKDVVPIADWAEVDGLTAEDIADYSTVVIDTGGRALDKLKAKLIKDNPKNAGGFGGMSAMGWSNLSRIFNDLVTKITAAKKDLVIITHMDEKMQGDETVERIDAQGSSRNEIYKVSDAMCRIQVTPNGGRILNFDPREGGFGKNPAQLPKMPFPHPDQNPQFLAEVITQIKASINRMTEAQAETVKEAKLWEETVAESDSLDAINTLVGLAKDRKLSKSQKALLNDRAVALNFTFDKAAGLYVQKAEAAA